MLAFEDLVSFLCSCGSTVILLALLQSLDHATQHSPQDSESGAENPDISGRNLCLSLCTNPKQRGNNLGLEDLGNLAKQPSFNVKDLVLLISPHPSTQCLLCKSGGVLGAK